MQPKKIIVWVLVIFALYTVVQSPSRAANLVHMAFDVVAEGANSVGRFFDLIVAG